MSKQDCWKRWYLPLRCYCRELYIKTMCPTKHRHEQTYTGNRHTVHLQAQTLKKIDRHMEVASPCVIASFVECRGAYSTLLTIASLPIPLHLPGTPHATAASHLGSPPRFASGSRKHTSQVRASICMGGLGSPPLRAHKHTHTPGPRPSVSNRRQFLV